MHGPADHIIYSAATEFRAALGTLDLAQTRIAELFDVEPRSVRRWRRGDRRIPAGVGIVLRLLAAGVVTVAQVEQATTVPVPVQTNGRAPPVTPPKETLTSLAPPARTKESAEPEPLTPLEEAPEQSALAGAKTAVRAVYALTTSVCHWPIGDPRDPNFRFCGEVAKQGSYCARHHAAAHMTLHLQQASGSRPPRLTTGRR